MKKISLYVAGLAAIAAISMGVIYFLNLRSQAADSSERQAVFWTNGQVYFGFVAKTDEPLIMIKDVYYLKTQDLLKASAEEKKKISLVKLGNELHAPKDEILVNRDQVLFIEKMNTDSKVNQAINNYNK